MKRLLAVAVVSVLTLLGLAGTASAISEEKLDECTAAFQDALSDHVTDFDEVEWEQFEYSWNDLWTLYDMGQISDEELIAGLDKITGGLFSEFLECLGTEEPTEVDPPSQVPVPTSVPAGESLPDTGAGVTAALIGLGLVLAVGAVLLGRRLVLRSGS